MDWIYDIETYPNIFTMAIGCVETKEAYVFEISDRKSDYAEMRKFLHRLHKNKDRMIGFNNVGFDYPVIHNLLRYKWDNCSKIYDFAMEVISVDKEDRFAYIIPDYKQVIKQVDLFKINHFDNIARATSLKMIEFNMRSPNIEDLPFPPGKILTDDQKDVLVDYNKHDVKETLKFYKECIGAISFRESLGEKYGMNLTNYNDTKIGKEYFIMKLEEANPGSCYEKKGRGRRVRQTKRDKIKLKDCIVDYVEFKRPEFQGVKEWLENQVITETKGVFSNIPEHTMGSLSKYSEMKEKKKKFTQEPSDDEIQEFLKEQPCGWVDEKLLKSGKTSYYKKWNVAENLNTVVDGFRFDFGTGGIHGSIESTVVESDSEYLIVDLDVASYYPNLAISNRLYPKHLGEGFCDVYQNVYMERKQYAKGTPENAAMKLALNGVYGASNDKYSPFYDPKFTMTITVSGQLSLCMLAEDLMDIPDVSMVQINTDGLTIKIPRSELEEMTKVYTEWEDKTGLELERVDYSRMFIRDVNNYIAEGVDGSIKRKGAYQYEGLGWHQNQSSLVIKKAAERALLHGGDIRGFVARHTDKYDFMLRTKVPRTSRLLTIDENGNEKLQQNICRYYISVKGDKLMKVMPPLPDKEDERYIGIDKDWNVKTANDISNFSWDIDYDYYVQEAEKLVNPLMGDT